MQGCHVARELWPSFIVPHLALAEILALSETCREMRDVCREDTVWKRLWPVLFRDSRTAILTDGIVFFRLPCCGHFFEVDERVFSIKQARFCEQCETALPRTFLTRSDDVRRTSAGLVKGLHASFFREALRLRQSADSRLVLAGNEAVWGEEAFETWSASDKFMDSFFNIAASCVTFVPMVVISWRMSPFCALSVGALGVFHLVFFNYERTLLAFLPAESHRDYERSRSRIYRLLSPHETVLHTALSVSSISALVHAAVNTSSHERVIPWTLAGSLGAALIFKLLVPQPEIFHVLTPLVFLSPMLVVSSGIAMTRPINHAKS